MNTKYKKLFEVILYHDFYNDGYCRDFHIVPTAECSRLMRNNSLLFRETDFGLRIYYQVDDSDQPVRQINSYLELTYEMKSKRAELLNYSNLNLNSGLNKIYCFSNLDSEGIERSVLHNSGNAADDENIPLMPQSFAYVIESAGNSAVLKIKDITGKEIISYSAALTNGKYNYFVETGVLKTGMYKLYIDDVLKLTFFSDDTVYRNKSFGLINILKNNNDEKLYSVKLGKRKTYWRYNVVLKYNTGTQPDQLSVDLLKQTTEALGISVAPDHIKNLSLEPRVIFDRDTEITKDNLVVVPFLFSSELPITETPITGIRLVTINSNGNEDYGTPVINNLPNPSTAVILPDTQTNKVYSDMYIYI